MVENCLTCANNKAGRCAAGISDDIDPEFICDFYRQKTSGAFRRKMARLRKEVEKKRLIEVVIKIPKDKFDMIKNKMYCGIYDAELYKAIANGTLLVTEGKTNDNR